MQVTHDDWSPLLQQLKQRVSLQGRRVLLFQMIGDIQDIATLNFGYDGLARPSAWPILNERYAREKKKGERTPNLVLTGALKSGFVHYIGADSASLTNVTEYADDQQFGAAYKNLPARPYYPISPDGESLTAYAEARQMEIVEDWFRV